MVGNHIKIYHFKMFSMPLKARILSLVEVTVQKKNLERCKFLKILKEKFSYNEKVVNSEI
jgi:hypothetical protein